MNKIIKLAKVLLNLGHKDAAAIVTKLAMNARPVTPRALHSYDIGPSDPSLPKLKPFEENVMQSIGFGGAEDPDFRRNIKTYFTNTPDNWVIIVFNDVRNLKGWIKENMFKEWLDSKGYPENSKILAVGSTQLEGDYESAEWIIHDVIGHSVGLIFFKKQGMYGKDWFSQTGKEFRKNLIQNIMRCLVEYAPVSGSVDYTDGINDIFASIVLRDLSKDDALKIASGEDEVSLVNSMFDLCDEWVDSIPSDSSKVTIAVPW